MCLILPLDSLQKEVKAWASYEISTEQLLKRTEIVTHGYTEGVSLKPSPLPGLVEFLKDLHRINFKMAEVAAQKVIEAQRNPTPAADALVAATKRFLTRSNVPMACPAEVVNKSSRCEIAVDPFADERYTWVEGVKVWKEDSTS